MAFNSQENYVLIHEFAKKALPTVGGGGSPLPCTSSPGSVVSIPRYGPRPLTNPGCTTVTGIAKGHGGPMPPLNGVKEI